MVNRRSISQGQNTPYLTVSDAEMTGFHEEVKISNLKIPRGTPWKGVPPSPSTSITITTPKIEITISYIVCRCSNHRRTRLSMFSPLLVFPAGYLQWCMVKFFLYLVLYYPQLQLHIMSSIYRHRHRHRHLPRTLHVDEATIQGNVEDHEYSLLNSD